MKIARTLIILAALVVSVTANAQSIRKAEVAGLFYPVDASALSDSIDRYLHIAGSHELIDGDVLGIIAPHAGYQFSGQTAGLSYHQIANRKIKTVFVLGPSHTQSYSGVALHHATRWETPIGSLQVDTAIERTIMDNCFFVHYVDSAFAKEHSVEDQLPFIQKVFGSEVRIVPIAFGQSNMDQFRDLGSALLRIIEASNGTAIVVASSDMSHFLGARQTHERDSIAVSDVGAMDIDKLRSDIAAGNCEFCGYAPVFTLMYMAERSSAKSHFIGYSNSAMATGDTSRVIGYGSFLFTLPQHRDSLNEKQKRELLRFARASVDSIVLSKKNYEPVVTDRSLYRSQGVFVTLTKKGELRGCIGYIQPYFQLAQTVSEMARNAAISDHRFAPVTPDELKDIEIEVSALGTLHRLRHVDQCELGVTGLYLEEGGKTGILLPQVPGQFGWDKVQFFNQLARKAGLPGDAWKYPDAKIYTFTAQVFHE